MTVAELQAKLPMAKVMELRPDCHYLILVDPEFVDTRILPGMSREWTNKGYPPAMWLTTTNGAGVQIFEVGEK